MNQYYNKQKAKLQAFVGNKSSNRLIKLTNKRNRKIYNYLHNASRYIVNYLIANNFETLVIGNNKRWKDEINIGKVNNQAFVNIPHARFINMLQYKCELVGIDVILREESYTSKCSFLDEESVEKHDTYLGNRRHRGLFISSNGTKINADCNGSGNITRKEFPNAFADGIEGVVVRPIRVTPYKTVA
jgi:putative transposase